MLVVRQEEVANISGIDAHILRAVRVLVRLVIELEREARFYDKTSDG